ncbi:MAG: response regulator [Magnetococcales bacterium]|nr:response regulator [Magnetococcales bacterium]
MKEIIHSNGLIQPTGGNVLVVDDNPHNLRLLIDILIKAGHKARPATSGKVALKAVTTDQPDLILLDIRMPDMDGYEVCRRLKESDKFRNIPVIFISAMDGTVDKVQAFSVGGVDFINKPFDSQEVQARVETHIRLRKMQLALGRQNELLEERVRDRTAKLAESELKYRELVENAPAILYRLSSRHGIIFSSSQAESILGYTPDQLQAEPMLWHDSIHPEDLPEVDTIIKNISSGKQFNIDYRIRAADGEWRWLNDCSINLTNIDDETIIMGLAVDITNRKLQQEQRSINEERLQLMMELNNDATSLTEQEFFDRAVEIAVMATCSQVAYLHKINEDQETTSLVSWNQRAMPQCSIFHETNYHLKHAEVWAECFREKRIVIHNDYTNLENNKDYPNEHTHITRHMSVPIILGNKVRFVLGVGNKMTLYDEFDAAQLQYVADDVIQFMLRREIEKKLHQAKEQAERASRSKSEFLTIMSHELRTPLNVIMGMGEMLVESDLDLQQKHYLGISIQAAKGLLSLISDILDLSQIEGGHLILFQEKVDLLDLAEKILDLNSYNAKKKSLELDYQVDPEVPKIIMCDSKRVQQILINLVGNAIKFTARGKVQIRISLLDEEYVLFSVLDTGIGIPDDKHKLIFEAFSQVDSSLTRQYGGSGLGLTICHRLVTSMGGRIWLESKLGKGSIFHFSIPLILDARNPSQLFVSSETTLDDALQENLSMIDTSRSILLVEDVEENAWVIESYLGNTPHHLDIVGNGEQAMENILSGKKYNLVLMDIQLPTLDGLETTRKIREWEKEHGHSRTTIIALTAHAMLGDREKSFSAGCDGHVTKPIPKKKLLEVIDQFAK